MCFKVTQGGRDIDRGKVISIVFERVMTKGKNKIPVGLTVIVMTFAVTRGTNNEITMIYE